MILPNTFELSVSYSTESFHCYKHCAAIWQNVLFVNHRCVFNIQSQWIKTKSMQSYSEMSIYLWFFHSFMDKTFYQHYVLNCFSGSYIQFCSGDRAPNGIMIMKMLIKEILLKQCISVYILYYRCKQYYRTMSWTMLFKN